MSLLIALLLGLAVGWGGNLLLSRFHSPDYILLHMFAAVAGAILGAGVYTLLLQNDDYNDFISMPGMLFSFIGAWSGVLFVKGVQRMPWRRRGHEEKPMP